MTDAKGESWHGEEGRVRHVIDNDLGDLGYEITWANRRQEPSYYSRVESLPSWAQALLSSGADRTGKPTSTKEPVSRGGRPRVHESNAEKQRAYRRRRQAKG